MKEMKRVKELRNIINKADIAYYENDTEIMSNKEYDDLVDELNALEEKYNLKEDSPIQKVAGNPMFGKINHKYPMLSLNKTKSSEELKGFIADEPAVLSYKMDGLTLVLYYKDYKLDKLVTRGNGSVGEDVSHNLKLIKKIPNKLNPDSFDSEAVIRGEAVMSYTEFDKLNALNDGSYKNPRNLASGLLRSKDTEVENVIDFIAYNIDGDYEEKTKRNYSEQLKALEEAKFNTVPYKIIRGSELDKSIEEMSPENTDFPVDGLVLRLNSYYKIKELGATSKFPRYAMAYKWEDESVLTNLLSIEWSLARSGAITPVAIFEPVEIEGTVVSRASLHNLSMFESFNLGVGDELEVYKANMIIPQILSNNTQSGGIEYPKTCPSCNTVTSIESGTIKGVETLMCNNPDCLAKNISNLELFVSNDAFEIVGLSEKTLELLVENGFVKSYIDILKLDKHKESLLELPRMGEQSVNNLLENIEKSKTIQANKFLRSFGITLVGNSLTRKMFEGRNNLTTLKDVINSNKEKLMKEYGFGDVASNHFIEYMDKNKDNVLEILELVTIKDVVEVKQENTLDGVVFCITGKLNSISRKELTSEIESRGGKVRSAVTRNTNYLVNNNKESTSSKNKTAKDLGIPIISEDEVMNMM